MGADQLPASWRVRVLGGFAVEEVRDARLGSRKARQLLKALVLGRGAAVPIAALADVVWPQRPPSSPDEQLGVLVSRLRGVLGRDRLPRVGNGYALTVDWLDVDELGDLVQRGNGALRAGRVGAARAAADAAIQLVRGPLLPDDEGEWLEADRAAAEDLARRAQELAAAAALAAGDFTAAALGAEAVLRRDPYDDAALRMLMRAHVAEGRPNSALAAYARIRQRLADDLGVSPAPETEALHSAILIGAPANADRSDADASGDTAAGTFVGRSEELARLDALFATAGPSGVHLVQIDGEAGIGKSALAAHFAEQARASGRRVVRAAVDDLGRDLPLQPLLDALGLDPPEGTLDAGDHSPARERWYREVSASVLGIVATDPDPPLAGPALLVVEDAHRADPTTRGFLEWLGRQQAPLLVLATSRPPTRLAGATPIELGPLALDELAALVGASVDRRRLAAVHARSAGNPLFALAIATAHEDAALPTNLHDAVAGAIAPLGEPVGEVIRAAAVLGSDIDVDLVSAVLRLPAVEVIEFLETAERAGVLVERGAGFGFRHDVVREVLDAATGSARRALLHREAAALLDGRPRRDPLAVAVHAQLGRDVDRAGRAFAEAGAVSFARADLDAAESQLRSAIDCGSTVARVEMARVLIAARRLTDAADVAAQAVAAGGGAPALEVSGWVAYYRRDYAAAQRFADAAVERADGEAGPEDDAARTGALALAGRARHGIGDLVGAEQRLRAATGGAPATAVVAQVWLAQVSLHAGEPHAALDLAERALVDPDHHAHPFSPLHGALARATALGCLGRVADAFAAADRFERGVARAGQVGARFTAIPDNVRAWLLRSTGRLAEADEAAQRGLEWGGAADGSGPSRSGFAEAYWVGVMELVAGRLTAGDLTGAERLLNGLGALDDTDVTMAWHQRHRRDVLAARLARHAGDLDRAAGLAAAVVEDAGDRGANRYAALARAEVALAGGDPDPSALDATLDVLERCAGLEGWQLALELSERFDVPRWRVRAEQAAARLASSMVTEHRPAFEAVLDREFVR